MKHSLVSLSIIGAMAAAMAFAQTNAPGPAHFRSPVARQLMTELNLSSTQKQQAKSIFQNTRQQSQPLAQQLKQDRQSLSAAIQSANNAQIQQLSSAMGNLQGQLLAIRSNGRAKFFAMLTPDQKATATAFEQKVHEVLGGRGGRG
jgi:Spy/CpxP family protein refolding chaperone